MTVYDWIKQMGTEEERVILGNTYDYFQQRIRGHSNYYKDGTIYKSEEIFGCVVELTRITFGVPNLIKLNKDDKQRADSFARALVARYLNLVEDCIANKMVLDDDQKAWFGYL